MSPLRRARGLGAKRPPRSFRWAAAGLLLANGLLSQGRLQAQDGQPLPPIEYRPAPSRLFPSRSAPAVAPPAATELIFEPAAAPGGGREGALTAASPSAPPDDGLAVRMLPPSATPSASASSSPAPAASPAAATTEKKCDGAEKKADGQAAGAEKKDDGQACGDRFAKVPPVYPLPRTGWAALPPPGPGYYSLEDYLKGNLRENPPKYPYPRFSLIQQPFFDIDWRYLDDPKNTEHDYWDFLKRRRFGPDDLFLFTAGGDLRVRYTHEENARLLNIGPAQRRGSDNTYDLYRVRLFSDLYITERFRIFAEFFSATSPDWALPPLPIDHDPADILNLFVDAQLCEVCQHPVWLRVGRQELLYGSQRLLSPLEWANTRRTFQGVKAFWLAEKDSLDAFVVQPVLPIADRFDPVDNNVLFAGLWYTHRPKPGNSIDAYYLMLDNTNRVDTGRFGVMGGYTIHTFGARWTGDKDNWLWDFEGMLQFGESVNQGLFANSWAIGGGYNFKDCPGDPQAWLYYEHASGTPVPGQGHLNQTFHQLFPFGHYYFGWVDLVGRRNINDVMAVVTAWPANWIFAQLQLHNFWLDSPRDALYNTAGLPIRQDRTGEAGSYVGTELDFICNFHLSNHSDILLAYGYMFAGEFIRKTATTPSGRENPQVVYAQYTYRW